MATDYRYNQFEDVLETVEKTEMHVVPDVSPFVVTLDEVPERGDPTTMVVKEVTGVSEGERVYGRTFTEVAETPTSGTFRPDYNTGADGDTAWNTGALLFSSADADTVVEVTYKATGTVASLRSNHYPSWWTDRGDGSDGDFYPTEDTTIGGVMNYRSVYIPEGVTVTVNRGVHIKCLGAFVNHGTLTATGEGAAGGIGATYKYSSSAEGYYESQSGAPAEAGYVSTGGWYTITIHNLPPKFWQDIAKTIGIFAIMFGGGGGSGVGAERYGGKNKDGGGGGGGIVIIAADVLNTATITADGEDGEGASATYFAGGSGGGGGTVIIVAHRISQKGTITANGGAAGSYGSKADADYLPENGGDGLVFLKEVDI